jgi:hypothetical protein
MNDKDEEIFDKGWPRFIAIQTKGQGFNKFNGLP